MIYQPIHSCFVGVCCIFGKLMMIIMVIMMIMNLNTVNYIVNQPLPIEVKHMCTLMIDFNISGSLGKAHSAMVIGGGDKWVKSQTVRWTPPGLFSG